MIAVYSVTSFVPIDVPFFVALQSTKYLYSTLIILHKPRRNMLQVIRVARDDASQRRFAHHSMERVIHRELVSPSTWII